MQSIVCVKKFLHKHYLLFILCFFMVSITIPGQAQEDINPLTIGDKVPDIKFDNLINYSSKTAKLSDFKGKLLILDFFATTCSGCIEALPGFDSLQQRFQGKIQILPVSYENRERVERFLQKNKIGIGLRLPFVIEDTLLSKLFPHQFISHEVWIGPDGIVKAITFSQYVNIKNIQALLKGKIVKWPVKRDLTDYDYNQPILVMNKDNVHQFLNVYYSAVSGYINNALPEFKKLAEDPGKQFTRVSMINFPIINLYLLTLGKSDLPPSHMILQVKDPSLFIYNPDSAYRDSWDEKNRFCYEGVFPRDASPKAIQQKIITDLNFFFNLNGQIVEKKVKCLVLVRSNEVKGIRQDLKPDKNLTTISINNLVWHLNNIYYGMPVLNETNLDKGKVLRLKNISDINALRKELKEYGLGLIAKEMEIEMFILTEKGAN